MKSAMIDISKSGKVIASASYDEPESLEEGIESDGEDKVLALYLAERKTREFMDPIRLAVPKLVALATTRISKEIDKGPKMDTAVITKLGSFLKTPNITPEVVTKVLGGKYNPTDADLDSCMELL